MFRIRSPRRDERTDASRFTSIERSIRNAIAEVESEKDGLQRRIKDARDRAAMLVGNETFGYVDREPEKEQELSNSEQALMSATGRVKQLDAQLEHLQRVLAVLQQK